MDDDNMDYTEEEQMENEDVEEENEEGKEENDKSKKENAPKDVYLPGKPLEEGEELVCDESAYVMLHQASTGAPCLSFDIIKDSLGNNRDVYPLTAYLVAGTQAAQTHMNTMIVMKLSNLHKTGKVNDDSEDESESDDSDDETEVKQPKMAGAQFKHQGCVNRIRCVTIEDAVLAASWSELGRVYIWNLSQQLQAVENDQLLTKYNKENTGTSVSPLYTFNGHQKEGFAIDWCPTQAGVLATGDCNRNIHIWKPAAAGQWNVDQRPLIGHTSSVEDLQWSPNERCVLASCSTDKSIRVWDTRAPPSKACMINCENAHDNDINVISWNKNEPFIASGGDDAFLKIWDLRRFQDKSPVAIFKHHTAPITSVEWHPSDSAVFASSGADDQIALWDLSVEKEDESENDVKDIPPQLLFIHQGQTDIKELHWHQQIPGVIISTSYSGFNIFKTISV